MILIHDVNKWSIWRCHVIIMWHYHVTSYDISYYHVALPRDINRDITRTRGIACKETLPLGTTTWHYWVALPREITTWNYNVALQREITTWHYTTWYYHIITCHYSVALSRGTTTWHYQATWHYHLALPRGTTTEDLLSTQGLKPSRGRSYFATNFMFISHWQLRRSFLTLV